eukprot:2225867-Pyramimonas_sp.AAC.1
MRAASSILLNSFSLPKGADETRPIALSNTDDKIASSLVASPIAQALADRGHSSRIQQGEKHHGQRARGRL